MICSLFIFPSSQPYLFCGSTAFCKDPYPSIAHNREYIIYDDISLLNCDPLKGRNYSLLSLLSPLTGREIGIQQAEPGKH